MEINNVKKTYSPSMDIQISSNFERQLFQSADRDSNVVKKIMDSFNKTGKEKLSDQIVGDMKAIYKTYSVTNSQTLSTINNFNNNYNYLADPHTATGLHILDKLENEEPTISLACAHPAKFSDAILKATKKEPIIPKKLKKIFDQNEKMTILDNDKHIIKSFIKKLT